MIRCGFYRQNGGQMLSKGHLVPTIWGWCWSICQGVASPQTSSWYWESALTAQTVRNACVSYGDGECARTVREARDTFRLRVEGSKWVSSEIDAPCSCHDALGWLFVCGLSMELEGRAKASMKKLMSGCLILVKAISTFPTWEERRYRFM